MGSGTDSSEVFSGSGSDSSEFYTSETYIDYSPYFDKVISNQQIFIGLFVALVTFAAVGLIIHWFIRLMKF